jgi:neutral trehalase
MIRVYVEYTNDTSIIAKALPTLVKEHQFFMNNRTVDVEVDGETYTLNHYQVSNTQPRPESYYEDYTTANNNSYYAEGGIIYPGIPLGKIFNHDLQTKCINYLFIVRSLDKTPRSISMSKRSLPSSNSFAHQRSIRNAPIRSSTNLHNRRTKLSAQNSIQTSHLVPNPAGTIHPAGSRLPATQSTTSTSRSARSTPKRSSPSTSTPSSTTTKS